MNALAVALAAVFISASGAPKFDAVAVMRKADSSNRVSFETARVRMELVSEDSSVMKREFAAYSMEKDGSRVSLMKFTSPANVRSVGLLVEESGEGENGIWQYLPATRSVRRISAEHKQNRFMGTEFVFEDFEGFKLSQYEFKAISISECPGKRECHVIEATPKSKSEIEASGYSRKVFWIDVKSHCLVKTEFYGKDAKHVKTLLMENFHESSGVWRAETQTMTNILNGRTTRMIDVERFPGKLFDAYYVSRQYLRSE